MRDILQEMLASTAEYYILKVFAPRAYERLTNLAYRVEKLEAQVRALQPHGEFHRELSRGSSRESEKVHETPATQLQRWYIWKYAGKA